MQNLVINGIEVRQNKDGLFSLNDIHKKLGCKSKDAVWRFTRGVGSGFKYEINNNKHLSESGTWGCIESAELYIDWINKSHNKAKIHAQMEHGALCAIEQLLGITLERQYRVGNYRIDGYHKESNTAYEIDEGHHNGKQKEDKERQFNIESKLGCKFVRIKV